MITREDLKGKSASIIGLGISNTPLVEFLQKLNCKIVIRDKKTREEIGEKATQFEEMGVKLILGEDYLSNITEDYIFRSPGIRYDREEIASAVKNGSILSSEMELFFDLAPCKIIGITGSDGKTTTTTLISLILKEAGKNVYVGGNIGKPLIGEVDNMTSGDFAVVELSSFQLQTMKKSPNVSVVTNISPNHLDYHKSMEEYVSSKKNIFSNVGNKKLVLNYNNSYTKEMANEVRDDSKVVFFGHESGVYTKDNAIFFNEEKVLEIKDIKVAGKYNIDNYMAAIAATRQYVALEDILNVAKTFSGVEHRMEFVRELNGIKFYNSSIDSSPSRTKATLESFSQKLIVISGGYDKKIPFDSMGETYSKHASIVVLTGMTKEKIKKSILDYPGEKPQVFGCDEFEEAIKKAYSLAKSGDIIILSPACASFDAFKNFEERGNIFKRIVNSL